MGFMLFHVAWATLKEPSFIQAFARSLFETVCLRILD